MREFHSTERPPRTGHPRTLVDREGRVFTSRSPGGHAVPASRCKRPTWRKFGGGPSSPAHRTVEPWTQPKLSAKSPAPVAKSDTPLSPGNQIVSRRNPRAASQAARCTVTEVRDVHRVPELVGQHVCQRPRGCPSRGRTPRSGASRGRSGRAPPDGHPGTAAASPADRRSSRRSPGPALRRQPIARRWSPGVPARPPRCPRERSSAGRERQCSRVERSRAVERGRAAWWAVAPGTAPRAELVRSLRVRGMPPPAARSWPSPTPWW